MTKAEFKKITDEISQLLLDAQKTRQEIDSIIWDHVFSFLSPTDDDPKVIAIRTRWNELQATRAAQDARFDKLVSMIDRMEE